VQRASEARGCLGK